VPDLLPRLIEQNQVVAYRYDGFWAPMDTLRDIQNLEGFVQSGHMPWAVWQQPAEPDAAVATKAGVDGAA